jgi:adenine-specific DNA-methyltransferase
MKPIDKLRAKLAELFQLDQADLDFGIYRIMNAKREEITRFLDKDLLPQVQEAFKEYKSSDKAEIQKELDKVIEGVKVAGMDPEQAPRVRELRAKLAEEAVDVEALENEVFSHLYDFFRRYYDEGDFISMRRYKEGVYAIPYEGEEVKLHWANHDQYYIKTAEYFRDYSFRLSDGRRVHFKIIEADTEKDNIKVTNGKDRRFFLHADKPVTEENGELVIRFEYGPDAEKRKQDDLNIETVKTILAEKKVGLQWKAAFAEKWRCADGTVTDRNILEKHLYDYTRRNTFDYFIHKDLGKFLRRELDFYIKNEVMHLDDVENESATRVEQYLSKIKVIRKIAHKIIDFLSQIEDFQKKLWLKKKFVVEANYCVTLDRVPEDFYTEIANNDAQREEWVHLFAIDEIKGDLAKPGYSKPLTTKFLRANPYLLTDTKFFDGNFKNRLLSLFENLDQQCDGLLVHSENFQALKLLQDRYREQVECIYIDPPYNTGGDGFVYKDSYQHSSWLAMIRDRLAALIPLTSKSAVFFASVDDNEVTNLRTCLELIFGSSSFESQIVVQSNKRGQTYQSIAKTHEYLLVYTLGENAEICELPKEIPSNSLKDALGTYELWELRNRNPKFGRYNRPNLYYPIYVATNEIDKDGYTEVSLKKDSIFSYEVYPKNSAGDDSCWRWGKDKVHFAISEGGPHKLVAKQRQDGGWNIYEKARKGSTKAKSIWVETEVINEQGTVEVGHLGLSNFGFPKPKGLIQKVLQIGSNNDGLTFDFFAGSGTTGHAVINLNREDGGNRKYILVEMGDYFDTVLKPRIKKVVYSKDWKNGKPVSRQGISHMFKYIRLESYEDALANLQLRQTEAQESLLKKSDSFRESYMLRYMLDTETKGSSSLLDLDQFEDPFSYKLLVGTGSVGETKPVNVDLVETFNWFLGLKVKHMDHIEGFRIVEGTNPKGEKVLVIWRKIRDLSEKDLEKIQRQREKSNEDLEAFFKKQQYNTMDMEFDIIYVNGDNNLMNLPMAPEGHGLEPRYKVRLIEEEFKRLMFDVKDV